MAKAKNDEKMRNAKRIDYIKMFFHKWGNNPYQAPIPSPREAVPLLDPNWIYESNFLK